jgi:hypothetical protein
MAFSLRRLTDKQRVCTSLPGQMRRFVLLGSARYECRPLSWDQVDIFDEKFSEGIFSIPCGRPYCYLQRNWYLQWKYDAKRNGRNAARGPNEVSDAAPSYCKCTQHSWLAELSPEIDFKKFSCNNMISLRNTSSRTTAQRSLSLLAQTHESRAAIQLSLYVVSFYLILNINSCN